MTPASLKVQYHGYFEQSSSKITCKCHRRSKFVENSQKGRTIWSIFLFSNDLKSFTIAEVAEELCKTAGGHCGPLHSFCADMPLLPSKSRTLPKHTENKENIEGGLDGRPDQATLSHSGTSRHAYLPTNKSGAPHCSSAGIQDDRESKKQLKRRQAHRLRRMAIIFNTNWQLPPVSNKH